MRQAIQDVTDFHIACDIPILHVPTFPHSDRVELRVKLIDEEVNKELLPAIERRDMVAVADGIADSIYVLTGMALEFGIPLECVWEAVQAANMAKLDPITGKVRRREDGKVLKPDGWQPPDIHKAIYG